MSIAAGTIVAKSQLSFARVLAASFRAHHADIPFFVLLTDRAHGRFDAADEPFEVLTLDDLIIPEPARFRFWYGQQELAYATTPHLLAALLDRGFETAVFLKQESLVVGDLGPVLETLAGHPISLTPHLLAPVDGKHGLDREINVLLSGVYNAGWLTVTESPVARRFLSWWEDRVHRGCRHDVGAGTHFEQRWLDLVPSYFEGTQIIRDPSVNVGHWNMAERALRVEGEEVLMKGGPCRLVRFSGYDPDRPGHVSRHRPGLRIAAFQGTADVFRRYQELLEAAGFQETKRWAYGFAQFSNGVEIPDIARRLLSDLLEEADRFADPFDASGPDSYYEWLRSPAGDTGAVPQLSRLWLAVHGRRPDLQRAYPDPLGRDREAFARWTSCSGLVEAQVSDAFAAAVSA